MLDSDNEVIITWVLLIVFSYKKLIKTQLLNVQLNMISISNFDNFILTETWFTADIPMWCSGAIFLWQILAVSNFEQWFI